MNVSAMLSVLKVTEEVVKLLYSIGSQLSMQISVYMRYPLLVYIM